MLRKLAFGIVAVASIGAGALLPTAASAHPFGFGFGGGWHGGWNHGFYGPSIVLTTPAVTNNCVQLMPVQTRHGVRYRYVNTCSM